MRVKIRKYIYIYRERERERERERMVPTNLFTFPYFINVYFCLSRFIPKITNYVKYMDL